MISVTFSYQHQLEPIIWSLHIKHFPRFKRFSVKLNFMVVMLLTYSSSSLATASPPNLFALLYSLTGQMCQAGMGLSSGLAAWMCPI